VSQVVLDSISGQVKVKPLIQPTTTGAIRPDQTPLSRDTDGNDPRKGANLGTPVTHLAGTLPMQALPEPAAQAWSHHACTGTWQCNTAHSLTTYPISGAPVLWRNH